MPVSSRTLLKVATCALVVLALAVHGFAVEPRHQFRAGAATSIEADASTKITAKLYELLGQLAAQP